MEKDLETLRPGRGAKQRPQKAGSIESKTTRRERIRQQYSCKKVVYENCKIFGPDGMHLCNCNRKKAQWYILKGLGEEMPIEAEEADAIMNKPDGNLRSVKPINVKLNFKPNTQNYGAAVDEPGSENSHE